MPHPDVHCAETEKRFGKPYREVHEWLDAFAFTPGLGGVAHRKKRHHLQGIIEAGNLWGDEAADVARYHIQMDLDQVGWKGPFPLNESHCEQMGLWVTR